MKTLLRTAAVAVASVALVAGGTTAASAAPGDTASVTIQPVVASGSTSVSRSPALATVSTNRAFNFKATVNVNGIPVANDVPIFGGGFYYERAWGIGAVSLSNFRDYSGGSVEGTSNVARVRYGVKVGDGAKIRKVGKKLTFKIKLRYLDNRSTSIGIRKASLQVKKGGKWRTIKKLKLSKKGTATYKRSDKKKRPYRLVIKETGTYEGAVITTKNRI